MNNKSYILLIDTDSNYVGVEDLLKHRYPDIDLSDEETVVPKIRDIAHQLETGLNEWYDTSFTIDHFNTTNNRLNIKSETVGKALYISAKKQYAQLIVEKEGIKMTGDDQFDVKGLDFMKASFPKLFREFTYDLIKDILYGKPKSHIDKKILEFREKFKTLTLEEAAKPTGINKYKEYYGGRVAGSIFSRVLTKCPVNTKAAIYYNDLLKFKGLDKEHPVIQVGEKMKFMKLKKNPYGIEVLGFHEVNSPKEIIEYIEKYMDRQGMFDSMLCKKLQKIYDNLSWGTINYNVKVNKFFKTH